MAFTVSITPTNPTQILAGETVHFVATPDEANETVTYQWQEYIGGAWTNIDGATESTLDRGPEGVGTDKIRVAATDETPETVYSDATWVIAASVYSQIASMKEDLDIIARAVE